MLIEKIACAIAEAANCKMQKQAISLAAPMRVAKNMLGKLPGAGSASGYVNASQMQPIMDRLNKINARMAGKSPSNVNALKDMAGMAVPGAGANIAKNSPAENLRNYIAGTGANNHGTMGVATSATGLAPNITQSITPHAPTYWGSPVQGFDKRLSRNPEFFERNIAEAKSKGLDNYFKMRGNQNWVNYPQSQQGIANR